MDTKPRARSASLVGSGSSSTSRNREATTSMTGSRKSLSRQASATNVTQIRPTLARASSSTASLSDNAKLNPDCFGGWDSHNYSRKIRVLCQVMPGIQIDEEKHRHSHIDLQSYLFTVTFGLLAVDQQDQSVYELGGLALSGLRHAALDDLRRGSRCIGSVLNMTGGVWEWNNSRTINCIYWRAPMSAEPEPLEIARRYFGCQTEPIDALLGGVVTASDAITIRLKMLRGFETDSRLKPAEAYKGKADSFKAQYRLSVTSKNLGDVSVPLPLRKAILLQALPYCKLNEENRETGALFVGKAKVTNGMLDSVAWKTGTWQPITRARAGF